MTNARITCTGDSCLTVAFEAVIDPAVNARCIALADALERERRGGVRDIVPGFHTVTLYFDPLRIGRESLAADVRRLLPNVADPSSSLPGETAPVEIPVRYGGPDGPDLRDVAEFGGCTEAEAIRMHAGAEYRVYMLGFLPGFAYLGMVDQRIAMPRLDAPRVNVAAGSIGIAGLQTAIYPCDSPGGWRIIGRTAVNTFDPARARPSLLSPGQRVRFVAA
jgi:KipI family sensor histidine kinase inhibitor